MAKLIELKVPDIGSTSDVSVIEVLIKAGDHINVDDSLITLETDKASMEVPATEAGTIHELKLNVGDKVSTGSVIALLAVEDTPKTSSSSSPSTTPAPIPSSASNVTSSTVPPITAAATESTPAIASVTIPPSSPPMQIDETRFRAAHASPSVRRYARELGVDLSHIKGSGPKGRILNSDVQHFVKQSMASPTHSSTPKYGSSLDLLPWPDIDFQQFGAISREPLSRIKKISGANLARNWAMIPHVTQFDEADITDLEAFRKQMIVELQSQNIKITPLAFIIKAVIAALKKYPSFNSSLAGEELVLKHYYHIGFAADTPNGLVVPVIKNADQLSLLELVQQSAQLAAKAREGKLRAQDMQGGSFSISSLGGIGGTAFTPIINAPEVAILGVSKASIKAHWDGSHFVPRLMLPLSLSYDHRVIDGALAARFSNHLCQLLSDIRRLVL